MSDVPIETPSDDLLLPRSGPIFPPIPDCPECKGRGFIRTGSPARTAMECSCILTQRVRHYLTPIYDNHITWDRAFDPTEFEGKDVIVENTSGVPIRKFQVAAASKVKSFLLKTGAHLSHRTVTPTEIFQILFDTVGKRRAAELTEVDLLVILFGANRSKGTLWQDIGWLLDHRQRHRRSTWVLLPWPLESSDFKKQYANCGPLDTVLSERRPGFVSLSLATPAQP